MSSTAQTHILAIDDDPAMRKLVADYLRENDLRVTAVATGAEMAQALGVHQLIAKPFTREDLLEAVRAVIGPFAASGAAR